MKPAHLFTAALLVYGGLVSAQTDALGGAAKICDRAFADKRLDRLRSRMQVSAADALTRSMLRDRGKATPKDKAALDVLVEAELTCATATFQEMGGEIGHRLASDPNRRVEYSARLAPLRNGSVSFGEFNNDQEIARVMLEYRTRRASAVADASPQPSDADGAASIATLNCVFANEGYPFDLPLVVNYKASSVNEKAAVFGETTITWSDDRWSSGAGFVLNRLSGTIVMKQDGDFKQGACSSSSRKF